MYKVMRQLTVAAVFLMTAMCANSASIGVYLSQPGVQSTFVDAALTETFDGLATGNYSSPLVSAIGTYQLSPSAQLHVGNADQYGGAHGTQYISLGAQSGTSDPVTLALGQHYNYFGFWWSAGDPLNGITFYHEGIELARFSTADITNLLSGSTVTAIDGSVYDTAQYKGNPNTGQNSHENYAYVNIILNGASFNSVKMDNSGSTGSGFETDNHSVYLGNVKVPGASVLVTEINQVADHNVPEPATAGFLTAGLVFLLVWRRKA